ncbi:hypothetical protein F511_25715 [Dorcoceras hygrometricum]|uniref:Uncharacterized protein n=1 Tax=Dorcoceras hygrometricum TaxID=472368 RepID=A0A2Z7AFT0_9LAMI|nr:hypothetical protein F511_25715 [Dorcoceras hygrometricum]
MVKRLATSPHDPLGITDSACKNQSVMVSVQYGPFNTNIPIRSTNIDKSRVARDPNRIMVKRLATSPHDPLGITDSACKNQSVMVSVQYGPFNTNIPIRSTNIDKSRVARDPITMHTSRRSNSDIACVTSSRLLPTDCFLQLMNACNSWLHLLFSATSDPTADCDDITADAIIADHNFSQSAMLTSSLLITASFSRHADVIIADSRFLFTSTSDSFTLAQQLVFVLHNWFQTSTI